MKLHFTLIVVFLFSLYHLQAQVLTFDRGKVEFYTTTIVSDIDAISEEVEVELDSKTGKFEVSLNIESFEFEYELMQEHFNKKYMESDKFPKATFKGNVLQDLSNLEQETEVDVSGKMTMHGVSKEIKIKAQLSKKDDFIVIRSKFPIVFKDFDVDEPAILSKKVAKDVLLKVTLYLK